MKKMAVFILLSLLALNPGVVLAHGDEDHAEQGAMQDMPGMKGMDHESHEVQAATLREAASALKSSRPDLAEKLEQMAHHHEEMDKS